MASEIMPLCSKSPRPVRRGKHAIAFVPEGYKGVYLQHDPFGTTGYGYLQVGAPGLEQPEDEAGHHPRSQLRQRRRGLASGSLAGLQASEADAERVAAEVRRLREDATGRARAAYEEHVSGAPTAGG